MTTDQKAELMQTAERAVQDMEFLSKCDEFKRFMDHFRNRSDNLADEILHGDMQGDEREKKRQFRLGILEVLRGLNEIHAANSIILRNQG